MTTDVNFYPMWKNETRANPHEMYDAMRQNDPIWQGIGPMTGRSFWFFTRYEDVVAVLKDQRFIKDVRNLPPEIAAQHIPENQDPMFEAVNRHMLNLDVPDHTRQRSLVHKAFTPKRIRDLEPRIEQIAVDLLDKMAEKSEADLIADFAFPLPITVIAEMLGIHKERRDDFRRWTRAVTFGNDMENAQLSVMEFVQYINELIEERRKEDKDDILSGLVNAEEDGDTLDHMELLSMVFLLLVAGHETTVNLIGNGTLALLQHPEQMQELRDNPSLINTAVEEMLRYNGPAELPLARFALEDVEMDGMMIKQGDVIFPSLLAANHDPDIFENPHTFDIHREQNSHVAFGNGIHYCLGAPLARMEGAIAINALLARFPNLALNVDASELKWNPNMVFHGLAELPVRY